MLTRNLFNFFIVFLFSFSFVFAEPEYFSQESLGQIRPGKENQHVLRLQQVLYDFGYYKTNAENPVFSGKFEKDLQDALKEFQKVNEIRVTGQADFATLKLLNEFLKYQTENVDEEVVSEGGEGEMENVFLDNTDNATTTTQEINYFENEKDITEIYLNKDKNENLYQDAKTSLTPTGEMYGEVVENKPETLAGQIWKTIKNIFTPSRKYQEQKGAKQELTFREAMYNCLADDICLAGLQEKYEEK